MIRWPRIHIAAALAIAAGLIALATSTRSSSSRPSLHASYLDVDGLRIRYVRGGHGPTVVLLHGFGESLLAWRGVFRRLSENADVIALDLPGFGLSSKPHSGYATDSLARRVAGALEALDVRQVTLVGHSLGGAVAAAVVVLSPSRVGRLVLLDAATVGTPAGLPGAQEDGSEGVRRAIAEYEALRTRFTSPHDSSWLSESDSAASYLPADDPAYRLALAAVLREFDFHWLNRDRASRIRVPTLVLWGEYDPVFSAASGRVLAGELPNARFEVISRAWHRPHEERPDEVATAIARFAGFGGGRNPGTP